MNASADTSKPLLLADLPVLLLDCQTTGPNPEKGNLLEIAWMVASASDALSQHQPGNQHEPIIHARIVAQPEDKPVPYRIQNLTGITQDLMAAAVSIEGVQSELLQSIGRLESPGLGLAHFARFEQPFIRALLAVPDDADLPFKLLCTYEIAKRLYPNLPSKGIRAVAGFFGTTCGELKRAQSHVESTLSIWKGIVEKLELLGIVTYDQLEAWLAETRAPKRTKYEYQLDKSKRLSLPDAPGVYRMLSRSGEILYVGKATSLKQRVNSYFRGQRGKDTKTRELLSQVYDLRVSVCDSPLESALIEADEIKRWNPPYNRVLKRGRRTLVFYSPDFLSSANTQSHEHPIGPFAGDKVLEPLLKLDQSLKTNDFAPDIFFYEVPKSILAEGFELFCINEGLERAEIRDARGLLALGMWLYRKEKRIRAERETEEAKAILHALEETVVARLKQSEAADGVRQLCADCDGSPEEATSLEAHDVHEDQDEVEDPDEVDDRESNFGLTPEELGNKFARALRRMARMYLRSKELTKLLHSELVIEHKEVESKFVVTAGKIHRESKTDRTAPSAVPWQSLDLDDYDRMSVLLSQVNSAKTNVKAFNYADAPTVHTNQL